MAVDDVSCDCEAESGTADVAGAGFVEAGESFEDAVALIRGDAATVVAYGKDSVAVVFFKPYGDQAGGVTFGVFEYVSYGSGELICVTDNVCRADVTRIEIDAAAFAKSSGFA